MRINKHIQMKIFLLSITCLSFLSVFTQIPSNLESTLNTTVDNYVAGKSTRGLSASIYHSNSDNFASFVRGYSHIENGSQVPIDEFMFFSLGSNSKILSSVVLLRLQEQGLLDLDDPINDYIPNVSTNIDGAITIKQLLQHRSGLYDYINVDALDSMNADYNRYWTPQEIVDKFVLAPIANPGVTYKYCNTNYLLAGMIIEAVTSQTFGDAVNDLVFTPGQVDSLYLMGFHPVEGRKAHAWDHQLLTPVNGDIDNIPTTSPGCFSWAAGGYWGKPSGLAQLYKAIFIDQTIINSSSLNELETFTNTGSPQPYNRYGLGIYVVNLTALTARFHTGSWWQLSAVGVDVENNNIAVVSINDTEGLSTSIDYSNLMIQMLLDMKAADETAGLAENENSILITELTDNTFSFSKPSDLIVYDTLGNKMLSKQNISLINLSSLPVGMYILNLGSQTKKVVIK